jgi:hypothetical protein
MNTRKTLAALCLAATGMLAGCFSGSSDHGGGPIPDPGPAPDPGPGLSKLQPTPAIATEVEVGGGIAVGHAAIRRMAGFGPVPLERLGDAMPGDARINAISTENPAVVLGRRSANPHQPRNNAGTRLLEEFKGWPVPTGKWSKGFFYQSPTNLDAWFQGKPGQAPDPNNIIDPQNYSVFAFPNKLWLDDRIGMVTVVFPKRRRVALDRASDSAIYDLRNPYKADYVPYTVTPDSGQDLRLAYLDDGIGRLPRQVDRMDELTIATSWMNNAGDRGMQLVAAEGSPYVTVRYTGLRPVVQVGQGILARRQKDDSNNDIPGTEDYSQWESDNQIVAVAVDEASLQPFNERGIDYMRQTPALTASKFRFVYLTASEALAPVGSNDNSPPPPPPLVFKEIVLYASQPMTLEWNATLRSYVARENFHGVLRAAFVDDVASGPDLAATRVSDLPAFSARRQVLDKYAMTYPIFSEVLLRYDGGKQAQLQYEWGMQRMDGQPPDGAGLLMMGFDATHIPSLRDPQRVDLTYRSNFGQMSAMAGAAWVQDIPIPDILQNGATERQLWFGARDIKPADRGLIRASLAADADLLQGYIAHCNYESYLCGKYFNNTARAILIADQLGETAIRNRLLAFLKQSLQPWFDGADPNDPTYDTNPIKDNFLFDTTNRGIITQRGLKSFDGDFFNAAYTDHMFHYGYFIFASAVLSRYDATWFNQNREKVNTLVRDIANPSLDDPYFPLARTFDWFRLQNFADSGPDFNGANTESSSESINSNYALALWGVVNGNSQFQALAAIMTAAEIRSAQAFYQVTPQNSIFKDVEGPSVTVKAPDNRLSDDISSLRQLTPANETAMGIIWQDITQSSVFFGARRDYRVGIQLLPISPISDYVISRQWAATHKNALLAMETANTRLFDAIINAVPGQGSPCFTAGYDPAHPPVDGSGAPLPANPGAACTTPLRTLYSWRQVLAAANGLNDPASAFTRYAGYMERLAQDEAAYRSNTDSVTHPGSSLNAGGVVSDVLKDVSTPSSNTNTLWWLSSQKP